MSSLGPTSIADADLTKIGMPASRQRTLRSLASALASGDVVLDRGADRDEMQARLPEIPGIGPWTSSYIAMRALGDPDAFLPTDLGVKHALDRTRRHRRPIRRSRAMEALARLRGAAPMGDPQREGGEPMKRYAHLPSPLGPVLVMSENGMLTRLYLDCDEVPAGDEWIEDRRIVLGGRRATRCLLERRADDVRRSDDPRPARSSRTGVDCVTRDPVRHDGHIRRDSRQRSGSPGPSAPWAAPTARTRSRSSCPCHRVIGANGSLTGYAGGIDKKERATRTGRAL